MSATFKEFARIPLREGDEISCLSPASLFGENCFVIGTQMGHVYVLRVMADGTQLIAGPVPFRSNAAESSDA